MSSRGHFITSLVKSLIRIISCIIGIKSRHVGFLAAGFLIAELLGIFEELVDDR